MQQENGKSIMEKMLRLKGIIKGELRQVNAVRLWLRVVTVTYMANKAGSDIMDNMMCGKWGAGTDLIWPRNTAREKSTGQHSEDT